MQCIKEARRAELLLAFVLSQVLETCELPRAGRAWDGAALEARAACAVAVAVAVVPAVSSFAPETAVTGVAVVMTLAAIRLVRCNNLWNWTVTKTGRAAVHSESTSASKPTMARFAQHSTGLFMDRLQSLFLHLCCRSPLSLAKSRSQIAQHTDLAVVSSRKRRATMASEMDWIHSPCSRATRATLPL